MDIAKRVLPIKDIIRLIIKSAVETGTPFIFNRDHVNRANPNKHRGMIYCSNLCTEIAQNMSGIQEVEQRIEQIHGENVVVNVTKPGEFVVCNLASLCLGNICLEDQKEVAYVTESAIRALDNVIDLNFFPLPYAEINNKNYRPIGLGVSGYHHMLAKRKIAWESEAHLEFTEKVFSQIHYSAIQASSRIAAEKGSYTYFGGSTWQSGAYFEERADHRPLGAAAKTGTGAGTAQRLPAGCGAYQQHQYHSRNLRWPGPGDEPVFSGGEEKWVDPQGRSGTYHGEFLVL